MKIFGRTTFEGYRPSPSQLNIRLPGRVEVEIFYERGMWRARSPHNKAEYKGIESPGAEECAKRIGQCFEKQIEPWVWRDELGEVTDSPDQPTLTHLIGPNHMQARLTPHGVRRSMCGKIIPLKRIVPEQQVTCAQCRKALEQMRSEAQ